jgi:adenosylcobyric acid synthase
LTAKPIFIAGTASHVGKSWVATALCRYLSRQGHRVAPFKAQNMSNNSMVCDGGGEIGRAQAAQAEACGLSPTVDMNPILLKPTGDMRSQVVLSGHPWRTLDAAEYYEHFDFLFRHVLDAYERLAKGFEYVVIEGAGSITELNLKERDLVNLGLARKLNASTILVSDIDRGGVFASVIGTFHLLEPEEARLVRTFLINRFRGDIELFRDGVRLLEEKTNRPCLGVLPFAHDIYLDAEDSVSLDDSTRAAADRVAVAIVRFPHISNFTDFRLLPNAVYLTRPVDENFDVILLPGTKNTVDDMLWLRSAGLEKWLLARVERGTKVVGICGGFQMMGESIEDAHAVESTAGAIRGLGLIKAETQISEQKITQRQSARTPSGIHFDAYEIHMGRTNISGDYRPFAILDDGRPEGIRTNRLAGTYLHGALENKAVLEELLDCALSPAAPSRETEYGRLADWFACHTDPRILRELLG